MRRVTKDFITLFNTFWYRDFPLTEDHKTRGSRAEWTTHIGICVRSSADLLGYFTHFEQGNRTDAVLRNNQGNDIAHIEWEWKEMVSGKVNEIQKLKESRDNAVFSVFISYSNVETYDKNLQMIQEEWGNRDYPLVIMLVTFMKQGIRWFEKLETHHLQGGKLIKHRSQPALPWHVKGSRWESRYAD